MTPAVPGSPFGDLVRSLARHWLLFVVALGPAALLLISTPSTSTHYVGSTTVSITAPADASIRELRLFDVYVERHIDTFARLATTPVVLDPVIESQNLTMTVPDLARTITLVDPENRQLVTLEVEGSQREPTLAVAEALGISLATQIEALSPIAENRGTLIRSQPIGASVSEVTERTLPIRAALAALVGLFAALAWVLWRFATDDVLRTPHDLTSITNAPVMATFRAGEDDEREADLLHLHLTADSQSADSLVRLVGTTGTAAEAFDVRERLLRSFGSLREAPTHVDVATASRVGQAVHETRAGSTATLQPSSVLVVVALRRVTGTDLVGILRSIEQPGGTVAGLIVHLPRRHRWNRLRPRWRTHS